MADDLGGLRRKTVLAHRILTMTGSMGDMTGHVFTRIPGTNEFLVRARNERDMSPAYVQPSSIRSVDMDGNPTEELGDHWVPPERFIGTAVFKTRPEINCVIHAHPPAQVLCSVTGVDIRPIVGSQNWGGSALAVGGIPVYPRSLLIHSPEIGRSMMSVMGNKEVVILKAHGNVVIGRSVEEATVRAIRLENLAKLCWQLTISRLQYSDISVEDWEDHARPQSAGESGMQGGANWSWEYYVRMLHEGPLVPQESTIDLEQY